jgi:hypothetical protein
MKTSFLKWAKKYHKWPALIISFFLILFSLSGIIMNHRNVFAGFNISRKLLPAAYRLNNWNMASVRSAIRLRNGDNLIYGNIGIWKSDSLFTSFADFNQGLGKGMDRRKVRIVTRTPGGTLLAGTFFGLYEYSGVENKWIGVDLPSGNQRVQEILCRNNTIYILTRSSVVAFDDHPGLKNPVAKNLDPPEGYDHKISLFRLAWITHSGEIAGMAGRLFLDLLALVIIFLVTTGLIYFFIPKIMKRSGNANSTLAQLRRKNLFLHNKSGAWFIVFLVAVPLTGMFLRPPFLITIANSTAPVLPFKSAGRDNAWEDKLRAAAWSPELKRFIMSASDGFFLCDSTFSTPPVRCNNEPPVSVMGINVFEPAGQGFFYVGSFDGLFAWNPVTGDIFDMLHKNQNATGRRSAGRPSENLVSGMIQIKGQPVIFDYDRGAIATEGLKFTGMPENIASGSPMALWNVAQEIHTGRIYQPLLGPFYILVVPLVALMTILVLITGYIRWRKVYRKANQDSSIIFRFR